jgi:hypothetical protein
MHIRKFVLGPFLLVLMDLLYPLIALIRCYKRGTCLILLIALIPLIRSHKRVSNFLDLTPSPEARVSYLLSVRNTLLYFCRDSAVISTCQSGEFS